MPSPASKNQNLDCHSLCALTTSPNKNNNCKRLRKNLEEKSQDCGICAQESLSGFSSQPSHAVEVSCKKLKDPELRQKSCRLILTWGRSNWPPSHCFYPGRPDYRLPQERSTLQNIPRQRTWEPWALQSTVGLGLSKAGTLRSWDLEPGDVHIGNYHQEIFRSNLCACTFILNGGKIINEISLFAPPRTFQLVPLEWSSQPPLRQSEVPADDSSSPTSCSVFCSQ